MTFATGTGAYARLVGRYTPALARQFCEAVGVHEVVGTSAPGDAHRRSALDVGCGSGALLGELARRLGPERVAGVDPSEPFLELARAAVPGADIRLASAEALPFEDDAFDVVMSQLVVNFMTDPERGVREMRRVGRGAVAACVWDYAEGMTMLRALWDAAVEIDPEAADEGRTMPIASPPALRALWLDVGLDAVTTGELMVGADYADFDDLWSPLLVGPGPVGAYVRSLDDERRVALRSALFDRLGAPEGPFHLPARAWYVSGVVPG